MNERVVVITGATGGLGRVAARLFAEDGHSLALLGRDENKLDALARELKLPTERLYTYTVNLLDAQATHIAAEAVTAKFGGVHILIHLVGGWTGGKELVETRADDFESMFAQHGRTTFNLIQAFVPQLIKGNWGRLIAVTSPSATHPPGMNGAYAVGKAAQETLLLTLAEELKNTGITSNIIQVQSIDVDQEGTGTAPEEIIAAMRYLCSDESAKVNGARIPILAQPL